MTNVLNSFLEKLDNVPSLVFINIKQLLHSFFLFIFVFLLSEYNCAHAHRHILSLCVCIFYLVLNACIIIKKYFELTNNMSEDKVSPNVRSKYLKNQSPVKFPWSCVDVIYGAYNALMEVKAIAYYLNILNSFLVNNISKYFCKNYPTTVTISHFPPKN